jgi:hypothetical protein
MRHGELLKLAEEAGFLIDNGKPFIGQFSCRTELHHFAELVAAAEREAIAAMLKAEGAKIRNFPESAAQCFLDAEMVLARSQS